MFTSISSSRILDLVILLDDPEIAPFSSRFLLSYLNYPHFPAGQAFSKPPPPSSASVALLEAELTLW